MLFVNGDSPVVYGCVGALSLCMGKVGTHVSGAG